MNYQQTFSYNSNNLFSYVKKEDAKQLLGRNRYMGIIMGIVLAIIYGVFEFLVFPELQETSILVQSALPFYSLPNFRYTVYAVVVALCFLIQPESEDVLDKKLSEYKDGEMILVSKLTDRGYNAKIGAVIFLGFAYLVFAMVLPVTYLTEAV